ncbi:MAG TPA: hypothetical protein VM823_01390 [Gaiellales bacterium]|jgi:hypothetical protein|nr:hypothetical protein [Gaiellales bacterium]
MLDERLGRHSVAVASLGLIPALMVIMVLALGIVHPGQSYSRVTIAATFSTPPLVAFTLGIVNDRRFVRSLLLAVAAFVMIGVWYAVLIMPAAALCTVARGEGCM